MASEEVNLIEYFVSGAIGGVCTVLTGHPIDTIKVRLQTQHILKPTGPPLYTGSLDCLKKVLAKYGPKGLYKGMAAPLMVISPIFSLVFLGYGIGREVFGPPIGEKFQPHQYFLAGALSGAFQTSLCAPAERIKCLLQMDAQRSGPLQYTGPLDVVIKLVKSGGIGSIFRGTTATLLRDVPASGFYFMTYELLKGYFTNEGELTPTLPQILLSGGTAGVVNWFVANPADVLKSRQQAAPEGKYPGGIIDVFKELMREEGPKAFFNGLRPQLVRAFIAEGACFVGFEISMAAFNYFRRGKRSL